MAEQDNLLKDLREQINQLDKEIIGKIAARMEIARQMGEIKKAAGLPITDLSREAELDKIHAEEAAKLNLNPSSIKALFKIIIALAKTVQK